MNERIRELKDQCWVEKRWDNGMWIEKHIDQEKFAQLIIRKCRDIVGKTRDIAIEDEWNVDEAMSTALFDIEDHFGMITIK